MVSSVPGDHNDVHLIGTVLGVHIHHRLINGVLLKVKTSGDDPLVIVVVPPTPLPAGSIERGHRLWVRGYLCADPAPEKKALFYVQAQHLNVVKRANSAAMVAGIGG